VAGKNAEAGTELKDAYDGKLSRKEALGLAKQ
jgi:hypothetical protein